MPLLVLLMSINFSFLLTLSLVDPFYWERKVVGHTVSGAIESVGSCQNNGTVTSKVMQALIILVNIGALVLANIEAYKSRHISIEFSESKYIAMANAFILESFIIGLPLVFLVSGNPVASFFVKAIIIFVVCMSLIVLA